MYWQIPETRANLERLAERRKLVLFDPRGSGLSERDVSDYSLGARLDDLAAVIDSLDAQVVDLLAIVHAGPLAITYAADNPTKVGALVLFNGLARGRDVIRTPRTRALRRLIEADWDLYVQAWVLVYFGWTELGRRVANTIMGSMNAESFLASLRVLQEDDDFVGIGESGHRDQVTRPKLLGRAAPAAQVDHLLLGEAARIGHISVVPRYPAIRGPARSRD